jgi:hypothetical protein
MSEGYDPRKLPVVLETVIEREARIKRETEAFRSALGLFEEPDFLHVDDDLPRRWDHIAAPQRKRHWPRILSVVAIAIVAYLIFFRHPADRTPRIRPPPVPGWERLSSCESTTSFDEKKSLELTKDHKASLTTKTGEDDKEIITNGDWNFDETSKRYAVTVDGATTVYSIVVLKNICMLIKGNVAAADLSASWFSPLYDDEPRYDDVERPDPP